MKILIRQPGLFPFQSLFSKVEGKPSPKEERACRPRAPSPVTSACGTSWERTSGRTCLRWPCRWNSMSPSTRCRGCVRSWSTASSWTRLPRHPVPWRGWWAPQARWPLPGPRRAKTGTARAPVPPVPIWIACQIGSFPSHLRFPSAWLFSVTWSGIATGRGFPVTAAAWG